MKKNIFSLFLILIMLICCACEIDYEAKYSGSSIKYGTEQHPLNVTNCEDFKNFMNGDGSTYTSFSKNYDGQYIEFTGVISEDLSDNITTLIELKEESLADSSRGGIIRFLEPATGLKIYPSKGEKVYIKGTIYSKKSIFFERLAVKVYDIKRVD